MARYENNTAELRQVPQAVTERIPPPRPQADEGREGWDPYPPQPRFTPRIQYTPRVQSPPPPHFAHPPTQPIPRPVPPQQAPRQPTLPQPALPEPVPWQQAARQHERPTARAIIGDELRIPILWCEFGKCVAHYTDVDALGERDLRFRALAAGWRYDLLGRLACPSCVQRDPTFWMTRPLVPVPRY